MSILRKPYEISVWEDVWEGGKFVEKKICVIGSNEMQDQARAFDPNFSTNVNGTKKLTFKLYKKYIDNITGTEVANPFFDYLINERKVKLKYKGKWHDFIIKNINETSTDYLYTYQLEDALVQELSKNGFNVVLDEKLIDEDGTSNVGTAAELAAKVLRETDWEVASEVVVETIEEALVYVNLTRVKAIPILDQEESDYSVGVTFDDERTLSGRALAFYSSCTNQPHRFQFIYLGTDDDGNAIIPTADDFRNITNANCQYYIDVEGQEIAEGIIMTYGEPIEGYYLPTGFSLEVSPYENDTAPLSSLYRGKRYGFAQKTKYLPQIDKYVNVYSNGGVEHYGYQKVKYCSPVLIQNLISNYEFKGGSGWTGTTLVEGGEKATVEAVYGHFVKGSFVSAVDELASGTNVAQVTDYQSYLKIVLPSQNDAVINSCLYHNRTVIENIHPGSQFALKYKFCTPDGTEYINDGLNFALGEYSYDSDTLTYIKNENNITFSDFTGDPYLLSTVNTNTYSKEQFKKNSQVKLCLTASAGTTIYLKSIELFEVNYLENGDMLIPSDQTDDINQRAMIKTYCYFTNEQLTGVRNEEQLKPTHIAKTFSYDTYKPVYNTEAEKNRSVTAKESNYFNILQNIAETFGMWLMLDIERSNGTDGLAEGAIKQKKVCFKNYAGGKNYAGFKYGVNLKDIQRTQESKNIVTKLIVKANNNKYAKNGFCSISRANSNPTGEDCIYDFQYYHNKGLLDIGDYNDYVYGTGKYFDQLKQLNLNIQNYNALLTNLSTDLTQLKAKKEVAEAGLAAAQTGLEEVAKNFEQLVDFAITETLPRLKDETEEDYIKRKAEFDKREDIIELRQAQVEYLRNKQEYSNQLANLVEPLNQAESSYSEYNSNLETLITNKKNLNQAFFSRYSRFIQEGTWISEEYVDDEKYYADSLSVMYNSCYPQAAYTINVMAVDALPGYEYYEFNVGETTFVEDREFFGTDARVQVNITETIEALDDPTKDQIKVQTYKNQFQDLFQKITATVQQTQYSTGAYKKAVELAEASQIQKQTFFQEALSDASAVLATAGQQTVTQGIDGITVRSVNSPADAVRIIGGAILLGRQDENGQQKWVTGVTSKGISANLITAGTLNAGEISIMGADGPTFRWDAYGISAYAFDEDKINTNEFVRFDKYGLYGVVGKEGSSWHATSINELLQEAVFALTWEGLKVTGVENVEARIGKQGNYIMTVQDASGTQTFGITKQGKIETTGIKIVGGTINIGGTTGEPNFSVDANGNVTLNGNITWSAGASPTQVLYNESGAQPKPSGLYKDFIEGTNGWYKSQGSRRYASYTYDGGKSWGEVIQIIGADGKSGTDYTIGEDGYWYVDGVKTEKQALGESITITATNYASSASKTQEPSTTDFKPDYPTDLSKDKPYLWTKTIFSDGSEILTVTQIVMTRAGLFDMLDSAKDGIYKNTDGSIAINASAINAGALNIGGTSQNEFKDAKFYASTENNNVYLAGWQIDTNGIIAGELGKENSMWLVRDGSSTQATIGGSQQIDGWCIGVGDGFGVTKNGYIYANKGYIGGIEVNAISSKDYVQDEIGKLEIPGQAKVEEWTQTYVGSEQFLEDNKMAEILQLGKVDQGEDYIISPYIAGGYLNITGNGCRVLIDPQNKTNTGVVFQIYKNVEEGKTPELVMGVDKNGNATFTGHIEATSGKIGNMEIVTVEALPGNIQAAQNTANDASALASTANSNATNALTKAGTAESNASTALSTANTANGNASTAKETADAAKVTANTAKSTADAAKETADKAVPADVVGNYSWVFNPSTGVKFYNGGKSDNNLVFKLTDGKLWMKGDGEFTGTVTATEGSIGGWKIDESGLYSDNDTVGLSSNNADGVRLYAGLEKRLPKGGSVSISMNDFIKTDLGDGWYVWSTSNRDEDGEILGPLTYDLHISGQTQLNIIDAYVVGFYDGPDQLGLRNMDIVYNTKIGKVEILMFETNCTTTTNGLYLVFDVHYKTDDASNANFTVLDNGYIYGERLNTNRIEADALISESIVSNKFSCESITTNGLTVLSELACQSIDVDGAKLQRKGGEIIEEAYTEEFNYKLEIVARHIFLYEINDKPAPATYKFDVQYELNGRARTMQMVMPSGSKLETVLVPSTIGDTLTNVAFVKTQATGIKVIEEVEAKYDDDYIDLDETLAVRSLKIGNRELDENDLANLYKILYHNDGTISVSSLKIGGQELTADKLEALLALV